MGNKEYGIEDLVLVHLTKYPPEQGVIKTPKDAGVMYHEKYNGIEYEVPFQRDTVHFTINGEVENNTGGNWDGCKYAVIIPLKNVEKNNFVGGTTADFYSKGSVDIPAGSYILCTESEKEKLQGIFGKDIEVVAISGEEINGKINEFIEQKGYKSQKISDWKGCDSEIERSAERIFEENNWKKSFHSFSDEMVDEGVYTDIIRTSKIIKIMLENGFEDQTPEENIYNNHSHQLRITNIFEREEFLGQLLQEINENTGIQIPEKIIEEVKDIKNGNLSNRIEMEIEKVKDKHRKNNLLNSKQSFKTLSDDRHAEYIADYILKRRIVGEIIIKQIEQRLEDGQEINYGDLVQLSEYTTNDRVEEFLNSRGIDLSKYYENIFDGEFVEMEDIEILNKREIGEEKMSILQQGIMDGQQLDFNEVLKLLEYTTEERVEKFLQDNDIELMDYQKNILNDKNIRNNYVKIATKPYEELSEDEKDEASKIISKLKSDVWKIDGYVLSEVTETKSEKKDKSTMDIEELFEFIEQENEMEKETYLSIINIETCAFEDISEKEIQLLENEFRGKDYQGNAILQFRTDASNYPNLETHLNSYENYIKLISEKLTHREKSTEELGKETLKEQGDTFFKDAMENEINILKEREEQNAERI